MARSSEPRFILTDLLRGVVNQLHATGLEHANTVHVDDEVWLRQLRTEIERPDTVSIAYEDVKMLSLVYRRHLASLKQPPFPAAAPADTVPSSSPAPSPVVAGAGFVHELLQGSNVYIPPKVKKTYSPEFAAYLEKLRIKNSHNEFQRLMKTQTTLSAPPSLLGNSGLSLRDISRDFSQAIHIVLLMFTGFVVFWYVGRGLFHDEHTGILCGIVGMICAMILETVLIIIRDEKSVITRKVHQQKDADLQDAAWKQFELGRRAEMPTSGVPRASAGTGTAGRDNEDRRRQSTCGTAPSPATTAITTVTATGGGEEEDGSRGSDGVDGEEAAEEHRRQKPTMTKRKNVKKTSPKL